MFKASDIFKVTGVLKLLLFSFRVYNRLMWERKRGTLTLQGMDRERPG